MPAWFSKVFEENADAPASPEVTPAPDAVLPEESHEEESWQPRRIVSAPLIHEESGAEENTGDSVRIKAKLSEREKQLVFYVNRPVLEGYSLQCKEEDTAYQLSPLASSIFSVGSVTGVTLHDSTVTVQCEFGLRAPLEEQAREIGVQIREHLRSGIPTVSPDFMEAMPAEDEIRDGLQRVIDQEINPGIAAHSGNIELTRVTGNTAYITMGGGCQGCAASSITLRQGVEQAFRSAVPTLGLLLDETDHAAGSNPFFAELPVGMGG